MSISFQLVTRTCFDVLTNEKNQSTPNWVNMTVLKIFNVYWYYSFVFNFLSCEYQKETDWISWLLLENVQRRATKFILNYPWNMSYRDRLLKLSLLPLEYRRDIKELVLIYKARTGYADLGHQNVFRQTIVQQRTRNSCELNYQVPHVKQNYLKYSFYYRSIHAWNKLPTDTKRVDSLHTFKSRLLGSYSYKLLSYNLPNSGL